MSRPLFALGPESLCASFLLYRCLVTFCGDMHFCFIEERYIKKFKAPKIFGKKLLSYLYFFIFTSKLQILRKMTLETINSLLVLYGLIVTVAAI